MAVVDLGEIALDVERQEEFTVLFEEHVEAISYFFARRGCPREECRDLTQETFLRAYRGYRAFRGESAVTTWLLSVATNVWKNAIRERQAAKRSATTVSLDAALERGEPVSEAEARRRAKPEGPLDTALERERQRMLRAAVGDLPPRMRRSVMLRIDRSLKYHEIAAIMQVTVDTVKTQLHQARQRLKVVLGEYFAMAEDEGD
jgi:RNA polymerase sigma-70 factor (ECF subfamily)